MSNELEKIYLALADINIRLIEIEKKIKTPELECKDVEPEEPVFWWSIQNYKNSIIINNYREETFCAYIKELGATWLKIKNGWMFPKTKETEIYENLKTKFPEWKIKDQRN